MRLQKYLFALIALVTLGLTVTPADAQYYHHRYHHRHRHCFWRHHHRVCRYY